MIDILCSSSLRKSVFVPKLLEHGNKIPREITDWSGGSAELTIFGFELGS